MDIITSKPCAHCKVNLPITHYKKKRDEQYKKTCENCLEYNKKAKLRHAIKKLKIE